MNIHEGRVKSLTAFPSKIARTFKVRNCLIAGMQAPRLQSFSRVHLK